ncbi:MAG: hypothetical protein JKY15_09030 [Deltaproteobacteria bacterium]|nr:hypothetical protein [Deltaproteobacteria bacterium]
MICRTFLFALVAYVPFSLAVQVNLNIEPHQMVGHFVEFDTTVSIRVRVIGVTGTITVLRGEQARIQIFNQRNSAVEYRFEVSSGESGQEEFLIQVTGGGDAQRRRASFVNPSNSTLGFAAIGPLEQRVNLVITVPNPDTDIDNLEIGTNGVAFWSRPAAGQGAASGSSSVALPLAASK